MYLHEEHELEKDTRKNTGQRERGGEQSMNPQKPWWSKPKPARASNQKGDNRTPDNMKPTSRHTQRERRE